MHWFRRKLVFSGRGYIWRYYRWLNRQQLKMFTRIRLIRVWARTLIFWRRFASSNLFRWYFGLEWIAMWWWRASTAWVRLMRYNAQLHLRIATDILDQRWLHHMFLNIVRIKWTVDLRRMIFKSIIPTTIRYIFLFQIRLTVRLTQDIAVLPVESLIRTTLDFSIWICKSVGVQELLVRLLLVSPTFVVFWNKVCRPF